MRSSAERRSPRSRLRLQRRTPATGKRMRSRRWTSLSSCSRLPMRSISPTHREGPQTEDFKAKMRDIVLKDDFLKDNFLSTDARIPISLLGTNACSPLATNALANNIWDNFSSQSYKDLPSVGSITVKDPYTGKADQSQMPAGGRGYTRVPSLISVWSTAPLLLN